VSCFTDLYLANQEVDRLRAVVEQQCDELRDLDAAVAHERARAIMAEAKLAAAVDRALRLEAGRDSLVSFAKMVWADLMALAPGARVRYCPPPEASKYAPAEGAAR
jgi:hypothetical protein